MIRNRNMLPSELISSSSSKEDSTISSSSKLYNILWSIYDTQSANNNGGSSSSNSIINQKFMEQQENIKQKLTEIDENITRLRNDIANLHVKIQANELELTKKLNENQQALLQQQTDNQQRLADKQQDNQLALVKRQDENQQIVLKQLREAQQQQTEYHQALVKRQDEYQQALVKRQDDVQLSLVQQQDGRNKTILNQQEERLHSLKEYMQMYFQYLQQLLQSQHQLQMQLQSSSIPASIALPPPPQQLQLTQPHITVNTASSTTALKRIAPKATAAAEDNNRIIVAEKDAQIKALETKNGEIDRARENSYALIRTIVTHLPNHPTANASDVTNYIRESVHQLENNSPIPDFNEWMNDGKNRTLAIQPATETQTTEQQQQQKQQQLDILNNSLKNWENRLHTDQELIETQKAQLLSEKQLLETEKAQLLSEKQLLTTEKELLTTEKELLAHEKNALFDIHDLEDEFVEENDDIANYVFNLDEDLTWTLDYFIYCSYIFTNADIAEQLDVYLKNGYLKDGKPKDGSELFIVSEHLFVDVVKQLFSAGDKVVARIFENTNNLEDRYKRLRIFYKRFGLTRRPGINTYHNYLIDMFQFFLVISRSSIIPGLSISDVPVEESFYKTPQQLLANLKKQFPSDMVAVHEYPDELFLRKFYQLNLSAIEFRDPSKTHTTEHIVLKYGLSETFLNYAYHIDTKIDFDTTKLFLRFVLLYKRYATDLYLNKKKINKHFQISVEISTIEKQKQYIIKPITNNVDLDVANWWQSIDNTTTTSTYDICDQMKKTALRLVNQINVLLVNNNKDM